MPLPVETHHAVETGSAQKKKIQGVASLVEALSYGVVVALSLGPKPPAFAFEVSSSGRARESAILNLTIERNDVGIGISQNGPPGPDVQGDHAGT